MSIIFQISDFIDLALNVFYLFLFFFVCVCSHWDFISFEALAFVGFLIFSKDAFFMLSCFSLTAIDSHGTLFLALGLVGKHSAAVPIWVVTKFSYSSFKGCLSDVS